MVVVPFAGVSAAVVPFVVGAAPVTAVAVVVVAFGWAEFESPINAPIRPSKPFNSPALLISSNNKASVVSGKPRPFLEVPNLLSDRSFSSTGLAYPRSPASNMTAKMVPSRAVRNRFCPSGLHARSDIGLLETS